MCETHVHLLIFQGQAEFLHVETLELGQKAFGLCICLNLVGEPDDSPIITSEQSRLSGVLSVMYP